MTGFGNDGIIEPIVSTKILSPRWFCLSSSIKPMLFCCSIRMSRFQPSQKNGFGGPLLVMKELIIMPRKSCIQLDTSNRPSSPSSHSSSSIRTKFWGHPKPAQVIHLHPICPSATPINLSKFHAFTIIYQPDKPFLKGFPAVKPAIWKIWKNLMGQSARSSSSPQKSVQNTSSTMSFFKGWAFSPKVEIFFRLPDGEGNVAWEAMVSSARQNPISH